MYSRTSVSWAINVSIVAVLGFVLLWRQASETVSSDVVVPPKAGTARTTWDVAMVIPRARSSGALSIWSKAEKLRVESMMNLLRGPKRTYGTR